MRAQFTADNQVVGFDVQWTARADGSAGPPREVWYKHSCCPFGWGTIYQLQLQRFDEGRQVAVYAVLNSRSEKP